MVVTKKAGSAPLANPQIGETLEDCNILVRGDNYEPKSKRFWIFSIETIQIFWTHMNIAVFFLTYTNPASSVSWGDMGF